ncbi:hypothetical protein BT93_F1336 [Corymbia citriodora subsp. variegata]|nr:hypothetical protein BT93_F1336 [Corymbia citriodora subsp. variegata]
MGRIFKQELEGPCYRCRFCKTHLVLANDLISQEFGCKLGRGFLFSKAVNVTVGTLEDRMVISELHTVGDISCCCCGLVVGWKYEVAHEKSQKDKEGKFMLYRVWLERECNVDEYESDSCSESSINTPSTPSPVVSSGGVSLVVSSDSVSSIVSDGEDV